MSTHQGLLFVCTVCLTIARPLCADTAADNDGAAVASRTDVPPSDPKRTERLAMLCKVWGRARYLHPRLATGEFDWDKPLIQALPKAAAAHDDDAFYEAVGAMLAALDDPATRVVRRRAGAEPQVETKQPRPPLIGWRDEDILVITPEDGNDDAIGRAYDELVRAVSRAKGVVVDLRAVANLRFATLNGLLVTHPLLLPGARYAVHSGYATKIGQTSGGYTSRFEMRPPESIRPVGEAPDEGPRRVAFLVMDTSLVPPIALALQLAGDGVVVAQGDLPPGAGVATVAVPLAAGAEVRLRLSDPIGPDRRTIRARADATVEADADRGPDGPALRKAVELLRAPARVGADGDGGAPPAPPVWRSDNTYAGMLYPRLEYRRLALFRAWTIIDLFFPYKHLIGEDWDDVLTRFLPRFEAAADAREYALAVAEFWASIHDSHGFVRSQELSQYFGTAAPAVGLRSIEGRPVVTAVLGVATKGELKVGDVVTHVDGEPVKVRMDRLGRYLAASTPQSHDMIVLSRLLGGSEGSTCRMTVRGEGDDEIRAVEMPRSQANWRLSARSDERRPTVRVLPGNVGYVHMGRLTKEEVDGMFETLKDTRAIIFDQRNYPRGTAWSIAPRLNVRGARDGAAFRRNVVGGDPASLDRQGTAVFSFLQPLPTSSKPKYTGRVIMLIDERTMSQAEHTGLFFEAACGATFIGSPTVGANGDVTQFTVPGGIALTFSGHDVRHADGRQLQRIGLLPDIEVRPTIAGIRAGRDEVLERALTHLGVDADESARAAKEDAPMPAAAATDDDGQRYADERFGFSLTVAKPWAEAPLAGYVVPGVVRAAWSGPASASIVAFIQQPGKAYSPRFLVDESARSMREQFDGKIHAADVKTVGGKKAMWLVATGKGTGGTLTGQGDVDTTTHWVAVPREKDIVVVLLTCPAADYEVRLPSFGSAIQTLKVEGTQTAEQSEAK